jgi:fermentation-respiration switch protein FrsA (DUF1100 family)
MRKGLKVILVLLACLVFFISILFIMQKKLIFLPSKLPQDYSYKFNQPFEEFFLETEDGAKLNAIHFKNENPKGVILYFHGNAGDLSRWGKVTSYFMNFDYDVVVMDYRTYGKSTGTLSEDLLLKDAQLFYDYVKNEWEESRILVYGRSLGTNIAAFVASKNNPRKLILESPFYSLVDVAKSRFPYLPVGYFLKYKFPTYRYIKEVALPIVIFHGTMDDIVPITSGIKLSKVIPSNLMEFVKIIDGNHNNLMEFMDYQLKIEEILN